MRLRLTGALLGGAAIIVAGCGAERKAPETDARAGAAAVPKKVKTVREPQLPHIPEPRRFPGKLNPGDTGEDVRDLQDRLNATGYWNGKPDGRFEERTTQAVYALQKAAGLPRDGVVGRKTWAALERGTAPRARLTSPGYHAEVDLRRQILVLVRDGRVEQVLNTSTGSGESYVSRGISKVAVTPEGDWKVYKQVDGWDSGPLGSLYRPKYFRGGIAVHGYGSVPPQPASHGCVRVSLDAMDWLWKSPWLKRGSEVHVY
ncbi:L,D-transpeptidase family protein [Bailinhaonella thermotolerans]|uniref:Murein L,D-transpeptidase n=1 Tax=Bailinhaonella thermotolerans TaxID=1070861 RepID=A0A3A4ART7_9ACTN|nr:L,D-transpeptidase family protein [Bailinhaonella thermotolerans]RJL31871.1 murein L,D-transpeptidase [Bailinhaonella thermotolerans]